MLFIRLLTALLLASCLVQAQEDFRQAISKSYAATFSALRQARTKADIESLVDAIDVREWISQLPTGETMTRPTPITQLMGLLSIPPDSRPEVRHSSPTVRWFRTVKA